MTHCRYKKLLQYGSVTLIIFIALRNIGFLECIIVFRIVVFSSDKLIFGLVLNVSPAALERVQGVGQKKDREERRRQEKLHAAVKHAAFQLIQEKSFQ